MFDPIRFPDLDTNFTGFHNEISSMWPKHICVPSQRFTYLIRLQVRFNYFNDGGHHFD